MVLFATVVLAIIQMKYQNNSISATINPQTFNIPCVVQLFFNVFKELFFSQIHNLQGLQVSIGTLALTLRHLHSSHICIFSH